MSTTQTPANNTLSATLADKAVIAEVPVAGIPSVAPQGVTEWVPRLQTPAIIFAIFFAFAGACSPFFFDFPLAFSWLKYPSSQMVTGLFCFGLALALCRSFQMLTWMLSRRKWFQLANLHAEARLASENAGLTPEAMQVSALRATYQSMRLTASFPHWVLFATCFVLLVAAIPIFLVHLQTLGRQTDFLDAIWIPGVVISGSSIIWLLTLASSAFASHAIQNWYDEAMLAYSERYSATQVEFESAAHAGDSSREREGAGRFSGGDTIASNQPILANDFSNEDDEYVSEGDFAEEKDPVDRRSWRPFEMEDKPDNRADQPFYEDSVANQARSPGARATGRSEPSRASKDFDSMDDDDYDPTA